MSEKTLLLVDGSSFLYRAFHAMPDLRTGSGEPTGAVRGMVAMLRRLRADGKLSGGATHGAVVFDAPGKTFRDDWYAEYKANRKAMPEDLARQIPVIHEMVRALGWPLLMIEGIEADDVIATLAAEASRQGMNTVISTGDKDLAQLVDDRVVLINTMTSREGGPVERLDREGVIARFGVPPELMVDWLTLVGDSVDNVPGVDKVGPKTAVKWLAQYGSLEAIVEHADAIGGVVGENLRKALDWLPVARRLVTVKTDCDLGPQVESIDASLDLADEDPVALRELFERCEFRSWLRELDDAAAAAGPSAPGADGGAARAGSAPADRARASAHAAGGAHAAAGSPDYETVLDDEALERWIARIEAADLVAFDTETTSLDPMAAELVGLSLSIAPWEACYVPVAHRYAGAPAQLAREHVLARLRGWLEDPARAKVGQNLKYDTHVLENHGVRLAGVAHDTLLESYVLEAHRNHDLDSLAERHLGRRTVTYQEVAGKGASQIGFEQVPIERAARYAAEDADVAMHLHRTLYPRIAGHERLERIYREIEIPVSVVLQRMERNGVLIDADALLRQSGELGRKLHEFERRAIEAAGQPFNLNSPKQLGEILFGRLGLPVIRKTASGAPSTDEEVLAKLAEDYPLPRIVLDWRALAKLKSTYTDKLPKMVDPRSGRVHTSYSQAVAVTGRLASSDPNLQNIPVRTAEGRRIREAFVAPPGASIVSADYSQIELRIMAHLSRDESLLRAFEQGLDVHRATAGEIFGIAPAEVSAEQRRYAKVINFGLIYGMSAYGLAANLGIERDAAKNYIERYFARYPGVARYMDETRALARSQGYVETVFGRRLWLAEINSPSGPRRAAAERAAINAPMQGTAADLIKMAMIAVQRWLDERAMASKLIMQVHDELVLEVPQDELEEVRSGLPRLMTGVARLSVPLEVECGAGANWEQAH
ncbi:MAG TPA: DNA polymerase I [Burkholderiaceae bacterium]|nr:DNA polymerase I [Burkholderiaceae bacterium]